MLESHRGKRKELDCLTRSTLPTRPERRDGSAEMAGPLQTDLANLIAKSLDDDKAEDIVRIDLTGKSSIADEMIIASGRSARHVSALADHVVRRLKETGLGRARVEGLGNCDWVLIDAGDVIVHLFRPEVREFYALERIWGDGPEAGRHRKADSGPQN